MRGGCSPVGMKKQFPTYMDESILKVDEVAFSAGKAWFSNDCQGSRYFDILKCRNGRYYTKII